MKRTGNIYKEICTIENIQLADTIARKGKLNQPAIKRHDKYREENHLKIQNMLVNKTYEVSPYTTFKVYEPKERIIYRLPYTDRIIQHAVLNKTRDIFEKSFTSFTYSCIPNRGIHAMFNDIVSALSNKKQSEYYLQFDIKKFYPSVDHTILKSQLRRKFKDNDLLWLFDKIIDSAQGLPIGNCSSQWLANFYLSPFDHWLKEKQRVKYCFRYADDVLVLASNKKYLHQLISDSNAYLKNELNLQVKPNHIVAPTWTGANILGYVFYQEKILLRPSIKHSFSRAVSRGANEQTINAYLGWAGHANCINLINKLLKNGKYQSPPPPTQKQPKRFKDFGIKTKPHRFIGEKIKIERIVGKEIIVLDYEIQDSKFTEKGNGKRLCLQILFSNEKRIIFTGARGLMDDIQQIPEQTEFSTTITKDNDRYVFN